MLEAGYASRQQGGSAWEFRNEAGKVWITHAPHGQNESAIGRIVLNNMARQLQRELDWTRETFVRDGA